jgi:hypothetical protein
VATNADYEVDLWDEREGLFDAYEAIDGVDASLNFQLKLAAAIERREPAAFVDSRQEARDHLRLLRLLGDGLAWRYLHPYVIRQLAKNPAPPPALGSQGKGFGDTLAVASEITQAGGLVLISDLTHCLRIGDLVVCNDPERPMLVECGGHPAYIHKGRKARQMQRANAVLELLRTGDATLAGDRLPTKTLALSAPTEHTWPVVDRVVNNAAQNGFAYEYASPSDLIFALDADNGKVGLERLGGLTTSMSRPVIETYTRLLDRPSARTPPCTVWDISAESRVLVFQGGVIVGHVVDVDAFVGRCRHGATISKVLGAPKQIEGFGVSVNDEAVTASSEFLGDVLLGFATIESTAEAMLEGVLAAVAVLLPDRDIPH